MKPTVTLAVLTLLFVQAAPSAQEPTRPDFSNVGQCGTSSEWVARVNRLARGTSQEKSAAATSTFTPQGSFPPGQVLTCGKFRLYYEDLLQSNADGFAHATAGPQRRNTLCAVLMYVQGVFDFTALTGANPNIDLYVMHSYAPTNPAPPGTMFLAQAGPLFPANFGSVAGFYGGHVLTHVTTNTDPDTNQYDAVLQVNFDHVDSSPPQQVSYWDDYANTSATCRWDLYSILLHEVTHAMGWLSLVSEDGSANHYAQNTLGNSFTMLDKNFLYYGDASTPSSFSGNKLVTSAPSINAGVNANSNPLRSSKIWMNNSGMPLNHPAYSGDFVGYYATPPVPFAPQSLLSHLNDNYNSFTRMAQYSPGFQPNYVMGPGIAREQLKREWTNFELRTLSALGYLLSASFANSTSLSGGAVTNAALLNNNVPPHRTTPVQVTEYAVWNIPTLSWAETLPVTATIATNNNTASSLNASSVVVPVSSLAADGNGDTVKILPGSLFNIRGCGNSSGGGGGNNHQQLAVNSAGTQVTFTPRPGFRGRAQFGFYVTDGKEKGSLCVATVDVQNVGVPYLSGLPVNHNKVMNGTFEDGTEVRQRLLNETVDNAGFDFYREGPFMSGDHLSDNQPSYNAYTNNWAYAGGEYIYQSWKECGQVNGGRKGNYGSGWSEFNSNGYVWAVPAPLANTVTTPNHRYHNFQSWNFLELITPVVKCHDYRFEFDVNLQRTGLLVGSNFPYTLDFVTNPGSNPSSATTLQSSPRSSVITTVAPNSWQHVTTYVPYCSAVSTNFINPATNVGWSSGVTHFPLIDNVAMSEVTPPPLLVSATSSSGSTAIHPHCCVTLTATALNALCGVTYTWTPGNLTGSTVTVCPGATTKYAVTVSDGCRTAVAKVVVKVNPMGMPCPIRD